MSILSSNIYFYFYLLLSSFKAKYFTFSCMTTTQTKNLVTIFITIIVPSFPWALWNFSNSANGNEHITSLFSTKNGSLSSMRYFLANASGPAVKNSRWLTLHKSYKWRKSLGRSYNKRAQDNTCIQTASTCTYLFQVVLLQETKWFLFQAENERKSI